MPGQNTGYLIQLGGPATRAVDADRCTYKHNQSFSDALALWQTGTAVLAFVRRARARHCALNQHDPTTHTRHGRHGLPDTSRTARASMMRLRSDRQAPLYARAQFVRHARRLRSGRTRASDAYATQQIPSTRGPWSDAQTAGNDEPEGKPAGDEAD